MLVYEVILRGRVVDPQGAPLGSDALDAHLDDVTDALVELAEGDEQVHDPDVSARLALAEVEVTVVVEAPDPLAAMARGTGVIRAAVHAAGGSTPAWEREAASPWALEFRESSQRRLEPLAG